MFRKINECRVCKNSSIVSVLDLGNQYLSGIFPKFIDINLHKGPLRLVKCNEDAGGCGHVQLEHTYDLPTMYGDNYGYRSGLNNSMINHLKGKYEKIANFIKLNDGDLVIDIAGNDGTFLGFFPNNLKLFSIDPTSEKFSKYFSDHVNYISDFFSKELFERTFGESKCKLITSFSMFYDLEDPCQFSREVNSILDPIDGIWVLEQSYMPEMIQKNSFDTICHEHLSYYGMRQLKYIMDQSNFKIVDFEFNDVNGGSISLVVANKESVYDECTEKINQIILKELELSLDTVKPWEDFSKRIEICKKEFWDIITQLKSENLKIAILGASTKGNVILQTWGVTSSDISIVGDVNPDKNNTYTPGTWIPIVGEDDIIDKFDAFIVLPWHFKEFFISSPKFKGKKIIFPLPTPHVVSL
jgi:NDP-4-keto-2,6-dideoxyhexose 3-C-methyltransferase